LGRDKSMLIILGRTKKYMLIPALGSELQNFLELRFRETERLESITG